jgi:outer membrane lipoprotein SlyB
LVRFAAPSLALLAAVIAPLSGCGPSYSPDTYATSAVQQANKVEQGVVVGVREVAISASGAVGAVTGAAGGGLAGSQVGAGATSAFSALGGSLIGGLAGTAAEHVVSDTNGFEYIIRKPSGDLLSVTQKDTVPLAIGQKVLVIAGNQARVVPDYTVNETPEGARAGGAATGPTAPNAAAPASAAAGSGSAEPGRGPPSAPPPGGPATPAPSASAPTSSDVPSPGAAAVGGTVPQAGSGGAGAT